MKYMKIFLLLILLTEISSLLEANDQPEDLEYNTYVRVNMTGLSYKILNLKGNNGTFYINILSLTKGVEININKFNKSTTGLEKKTDMYPFKTFKIEELDNEGKYINFSVSQDCIVEITSVLKNDHLRCNEYKKVDYEIDTEIKVDKNNFVIFLDDEDVEKFEMKFNFKDDIKNKQITYGFINLPTKDENYLVLGKHYKNNDSDSSQLEQAKFSEAAKQITVDNPFHKKSKDSIKSIKPNLAFIFSIENEGKMIEEFSFTINSEIINVFLIVSIVIALVFAVITFFLIRRKQTSEMLNVEGGENFYKKEEKEKDDKEEATEN